MSSMTRSACCAASGASDAGEQTSMTPPLRQALLAQYDAHKSWSAQLHHDNLVALAETRVRAAAGAILRDGPAIPGRPRPDQASHR